MHTHNPKNNSHMPNGFFKSDQKGSIQTLSPSSTMESGHQNFPSSQNLLQNKFFEWLKRLEDVQKQFPLLDNNQFEQKINHLTRLLDKIFQLFFLTFNQDDRLEKNLADLLELLLQDATKFEDLPELSQEDLKILGDFKTILPPEDWNEVMDDACYLLSDPDIMNDAMSQLSVHNHDKAEQCSQETYEQDKDMEILITLMKNCKITQ